MIISVDPGKNHCGVALWNTTSLFRAWLCPSSEVTSQFGVYGGLHDLVIERMQVYRKGDIDLNDLIDISIVTGIIIGVVGDPTPTLLRPREWKHNVPKEIHQPRIMAALRPEELEKIEWPSARKTLGHNVVDAVGIGLFSLGRIGKYRGRRR